jgi:four helix bundle protein
MRVWQAAMALARQVYLASEDFPADERFGLTNQLRRSAVSVPSNIAEGAARGSKRDFVRFLLIARGSLSELDTQVRLAHDLGLTEDVTELLAAIDQLFAAMAALIKSQQRAPLPQ